MTRRHWLLAMLFVGSLVTSTRIAAWLRSPRSVVRNGWVLSVDD